MSSENDPIPGSCIVLDEQETNAIEPKPEDALSKTQMKKLKARERWLEHRKIMRIEEKEKRKTKRKALRESGQGASLKRVKAKTMAESTSKIRIVVDMSFDHLMNEKDCRRAVMQLNWCYSVNRKAEQPLQYYVVGFDGPSRTYYDSIETNKNQDIYINEQPLDQAFPPSEIVYLTADSDNILTSLDETKVYVIGGLVDHNAHKGLCFQIAEKKGYGHARLPIDEFVNMKTRKVLTVNHVFEILLRFSECNDWEKAFFAVMPQRKGMTKKEDEEEKIIEEEEQRMAEEEEESVKDSEINEEEVVADE